jgi:putative spermidine/putrescine transport system permease protein
VTGRRSSVWLLVVPLAALMLVAYLAPLTQPVEASLHPNTPAGIDATRWTLENYARLLDDRYLEVLIRTLRVSAIVAGLSMLLAYPVAGHLVRQSGRVQAWLLLAYVSPWLVNTVVKSFGWSLLLNTNGVINRTLRDLGLIDAPLRLMLNETGIVIGLVPGHFLFVLLPVWAVLKGVDPNLRFAAATLGARPWRVFVRVTLPLTARALIAGLLINFTMNMAAFATPALLGGTRARMLSFVAYQVNLETLNWPLGGAMAVVLLALSLAIVWLAQRLAPGPAGATRA